jgi:hypothetical protein
VGTKLAGKALMGTGGTVDPLAALEQTESSFQRDTLKLAFATMDDAEQARWTAVLDGEARNPRTGQPFSSDHVVRAFKAAGYNVSPAAVRRWRRNV